MPEKCGTIFCAGADINVFAVKTMILSDFRIRLQKKEVTSAVAVESIKFQSMIKSSCKVGEFTEVSTTAFESQGKLACFANFTTNGIFLTQNCVLQARPLRLVDDPVFTLSKVPQDSSSGNTGKFDAYKCTKKDLFKLKTLQTVAKATTMSQEVELFLQPDNPLFIRYKIGTIGTLTLCIIHEKEIPRTVEKARSTNPHEAETFNQRLTNYITSVFSQEPLSFPSSKVTTVKSEEAQVPVPAPADFHLDHRPSSHDRLSGAPAAPAARIHGHCRLHPAARLHHALFSRRARDRRRHPAFGHAHLGNLLPGLQPAEILPHLFSPQPDGRPDRGLSRRPDRRAMAPLGPHALRGGDLCLRPRAHVLDAQRR